jgi:pyruvate formate lyase activating enzyme
MKALGVDKDVDWLFQDLIKDKAYFGTSGGVTFSGGEALIQAKAAAVLAEKLKSAGIKVAIDTCGHVPYHHFEMLLPHVEMFLYDLKLIDSKQHEALTKEPNQLILDNLIRLNQAKKTIWIRTPIIPGATDNETNITGIASFIKENQICFERWELCAFNNLGKDKYRRLGIPWRYDEAKLMEKKTMEQLTMAARKVFGDEERRIIWTGATRLEEN